MTSSTKFGISDKNYDIQAASSDLRIVLQEINELLRYHLISFPDRHIPMWGDGPINSA
jgi:hypothetical protein